MTISAGWVVLGGGTHIKDPHANFRDAFAGSSHSGSDASQQVLSGNYIADCYVSSVCNSDFQGPQRLCGVVERQLRTKRSAQSGSDTKDRRSPRLRNLRRFIHVCEYRLFCVSVSTVIDFPR